MDKEKFSIQIKAVASEEIKEVKSKKPKDLTNFVKANTVEEIPNDRCSGPDRK